MGQPRPILSSIVFAAMVFAAMIGACSRANDHQAATKPVAASAVAVGEEDASNDTLSDKPTEAQPPGPNEMAPELLPPTVPEIAAPRDCQRAPSVKIIYSADWWEKMYGSNGFYHNYFSPVLHYKGVTYFVWVNRKLEPTITVIKDNGESKDFPLHGKPDGSEKAEYKARENSHNLFSIGVDSQGYLHVTGDMQHGPNPRTKAFPSEFNDALTLYWVSRAPGTAEQGFEFLGNHERGIPANRVNGIRFFYDTYNTLYSSAVVSTLPDHASGERGIGLYRYEPSEKKWAVLGARPQVGKTQGEYPLFFWDFGGTPADPKKPNEARWWQGFFSYVRFDLNNVMHFASAINDDLGKVEENRIVYAYSKDRGETWLWADNTKIPGLPLGSKPSNDNRADTVAEGRFQWHTAVVAGSDGQPLVHLEARGGSKQWYHWNGSKWQADRALNDTDFITEHGYNIPGGSILLTSYRSAEKLACARKAGEPAKVYAVDELKGMDEITSIDEYGLRTTGVAYGMAIDQAKGRQHVIRIEFPADGN